MDASLVFHVVLIAQDGIVRAASPGLARLAAQDAGGSGHWAQRYQPVLEGHGGPSFGIRTHALLPGQRVVIPGIP